MSYFYIYFNPCMSYEKRKNTGGSRGPEFLV